MSIKQLDVNIMGQSYILACPEGGEAVLTAAVRQVDREMCTIRDAGRVKARERIAVLAALNLAYSLIEQRTKDAHPSPLPTTPEVMAAPAPAAAPITIDVDGLVRRIEAALGDGDHAPT